MKETQFWIEILLKRFSRNKNVFLKTVPDQREDVSRLFISKCSFDMNLFMALFIPLSRKRKDVYYKDKYRSATGQAFARISNYSFLKMFLEVFVFY